MLHPELRKWISGKLRLWVALTFLFIVWAMTDQFWIGLIGAAVAWFRIAGPIEELLARAGGGDTSGRYGERRYSFEDPEPISDEALLPRYSAPAEVSVSEADPWDDEDEEPHDVEPPPVAPPSRPMSSVKIPPRKPVDLPRRQ